MKAAVEKIKKHSEYVETKRLENGISLLELDKIKSFEKNLKIDQNNEMIAYASKLKLKREAGIESRLVQQDEDKFIEI